MKVGLATLALIASSLGWGVEARAGDDNTHSGVKVLLLRTTSGEIRIRSSGDDTVRLEERRRRSRLEVDREGDQLELRTVSDRLELEIPEGIRVEIETRSGNVRLDAAPSQVGIRTTSGDLRLEGRTDIVEIDTISGDLEMDMAAKLLRITTVSGDIEVDASVDEIIARTTSGDVEIIVSDLPKRLELKTVSGDVEMKGDLPKDALHRATSMSGELGLTCTNSQGFRLQARTFSGSIRAPGGPQVKRGTLRRVIDGGGADLRFESFSGRIRVER